ncbi:hypothetical protein O181_021337 [Austropuccinia psidii MF-1]|uniref:Uncharacterized protein n=1 Tax=Austropuccinia psidii MF-1 TaxID=1389203 RepID=A0A9Q3CFC7_9BASI|nr:hypothetical protein [Austropuccinia psidii MF-1]
MSPVHRKLGFQRNKPEDTEGLSRTRRPGGGHLGHSGGWKYIEGSYTHSAIHIPIQQKLQTRGLEGYGSSSSAPPTPQRTFSMEHGQQEVQPSITLGRTWGKLPEDMSQRNRLQRPYDRAYSDSFRLKRSRQNQLSSGFTPFRNQEISGQESPFFTLQGNFQEKTRIQGKKQDLFQPKAERVRPNDPEAVGLGERSTQEPEIVLHTARISSPINKKTTPTQIQHNVDTPESSLKSDSLWLQISQFAEKTQKQFAKIQEIHERMKTLTASMDKIVKSLQVGYAQLSKVRRDQQKTESSLCRTIPQQKGQGLSGSRHKQTV